MCSEELGHIAVTKKPIPSVSSQKFKGEALAKFLFKKRRRHTAISFGGLEQKIPVTLSVEDQENLDKNPSTSNTI